MYIHMYIHMYMHMHMYIHMYMHMHMYMYSYYNAWMETYTEEEYNRHSGTLLEAESESEGSSDSDSDNEQLGGSSIEFQNGTFSEESFGSDLSEESINFESDSYHSANEEVVFRESEEDVFTFSPSQPDNEGFFNKQKESHGGQEVVFMDNFSESSDGSVEGLLGKLETQVMNLSISKFRRCSTYVRTYVCVRSFNVLCRPTTESSDTVVFADSSRTSSKPLSADKVNPNMCHQPRCTYICTYVHLC